jgi:hypothetical protein
MRHFVTQVALSQICPVPQLAPSAMFVCLQTPVSHASVVHAFVSAVQGVPRSF